MRDPVCEQVAERVALGDALAELSEHAATCARCRGLVAVSSQLGATHQDIDPGLGFSARMTVGAQHRIAVRRRRRLAAGLAATVASGALGVFFVTRTPQAPPHKSAVELSQRPTPEQNPPASEQDELEALLQLADVDTSSRLSARWSRIQKPLAPYKKLLKGETP